MKTIEQNKTCKVNCETKGEMAREFNAALDAQRRFVNSLIRKGRFSSGIPDGVVKEDDTSHASCPLDGGSHWKFLHDLRVAGSCPLRRTEDANGCRVFGDNGLYSFRADDGNVHIHARGVCMGCPGVSHSLNDLETHIRNTLPTGTDADIRYYPDSLKESYERIFELLYRFNQKENANAGWRKRLYAVALTDTALVVCNFQLFDRWKVENQAFKLAALLKGNGFMADVVPVKGGFKEEIQNMKKIMHDVEHLAVLDCKMIV